MRADATLRMALRDRASWPRPLGEEVVRIRSRTDCDVGACAKHQLPGPVFLPLFQHGRDVLHTAKTAS